MTGVMPLPPAKNVSPSACAERSPKCPAGCITSSASPSRTASFIQFEARPRATRFTVTFHSGSRPGALASE
jgi:hypothetical protein